MNTVVLLLRVGLSLAVVLRRPGRHTEHFARLKVPLVRGRFLPVAGRPGEVVPIEALTDWLAGHGMTRAEVVEVAGEFSVRGGILDVFPPDGTEPVRVEFFGDEVESIRPFDPETQRSAEPPPALRELLLAAQVDVPA